MTTVLPAITKQAARPYTLGELMVATATREIHVGEVVGNLAQIPEPAVEELKAIREYDKEGFWTR